MAEEELKIEEGGKKGKMMIIIIAAVVIVVGAAVAYFCLSDDDSSSADIDAVETGSGVAQSGGAAQTGTALYVAIARPFVLNVPGASRERLIEIKVQLMVRGSENEEIVKSHLTSIRGTLLQVFSSSNADDLITEAGKIALRDEAVREVQIKMQELAGADVVEEVLFTGFVMQ